MHEGRFDALGAPSLDAQILRGVVTIVTLGLRVARLAELFLLDGELAVPARKVAIVAKKRLGQDASQIARLVARSALAAAPLLFVFVTAETLAHRRRRRLARLDHAAMTGHALSANPGHL